MRVLFIYRFLTLGGVETVLRTRADFLPSQGIEARFWFLEHVDGLPLFRDMLDRVSIGGLSRLEDHLASQTYDAISVIDTPEALAVCGTPRSRRALVLECHTPYRENLIYLSEVSRPPVASVVVPSSWQEAEVRRRLRAEIDILVIPNPLGVRFAEPLRSFDPAPSLPIVAWLGRLDDLKNWSAFVELVGELAQRRLDFDVWMAARSPSEGVPGQLFALAQHHGVLDRLKWFRNLSHAAVPRFLDAVRDSGGLVVSTALGESFGMTVAEAMARACAVVVPQNGPFPEFIQHNSTGLLIPSGDRGQAVASCERLLGDRELRQELGQNARRSILAEHQPEPAVVRLANALRRLVDTAGSDAQSTVVGLARPEEPSAR